MKGGGTSPIVHPEYKIDLYQYFTKLQFYNVCGSCLVAPATRPPVYPGCAACCYPQTNFAFNSSYRYSNLVSTRCATIMTATRLVVTPTQTLPIVQLL